MIPISDGDRRRAFSIWLRTGRVSPVVAEDGLELKFNPWHDPADGRFTFAGSGRNHGGRGADRINRAGGHPLGIGHRSRSLSPSNAAKTRPTSSGRPTKSGAGSGSLSTAATPPGPQRTLPSSNRNPTAEFLGGAGEGLYHVGKETVAGAYSLVTTNPITTVSNAAIGVAETIDSVLVAENTPARVHIARAVDTIAKASPRDLGRATGSIVGNVGLAVVPGAALSKVSALRRLRAVTPRTTYDPPQIGWMKETTRSGKPWKAYNDSATGARPAQAPTLMRTMADGSKRPVKFDGVQGDYVIDRKWSVVSRPRARDQILRQSAVLAEHRLIGTWEVPSPVQKTKALKLLKQLKITNIHVKVVKP